MKHYLIYGLGITGQALLDYFEFQGELCFAYNDHKTENAEELQKKYKMASFFFSELEENIWNEIKVLIISPGVSRESEVVQKAIQKKIPVIGELEFASRLIEKPIIAVTGTNGKSTTVSLLEWIFKTSGIDVSLKGNIGSPLISALCERPSSFIITEVSSFQLETIESFKPQISVLLNVTADHCDRYENMNDYALTKGRIFENQTKDDFFIYNADDLYALKLSKKTKSRKLPFSLVNSFEEGAFVEKDEFIVRYKNKEYRYPINEASLKGLHNQENILASLLVAHISALPQGSIQEALKTFKSLSHRMEFIGQYRGISFYDDSKATNVAAVVMSLASFEKNVILILGGRDKGGDYKNLIPLIKAKTKAIFLIGEAADIIKEQLSEIRTYEFKSMQACIKKAYELGHEGDTVLLSPACSSFDMYRNYQERGQDFKEWVKKLN